MSVIGGVELAAGGPPAKNEHPRLPIRKRDLPLYRQRIEGPYKEDFARFRSCWDKKDAEPGYDWTSSGHMDGVALGVRSQ